MKRIVWVMALAVLAGCGADGAPEVQPDAPNAVRLSGTASIGLDGGY